MELGLSLGGDSTPVASVADDQISRSKQQQKMNKDLRFCMALGSSTSLQNHDQDDKQKNFGENINEHEKTNCRCSSTSDPPLQLQLDLLPFSPSPPPLPSHRSFPWLSQILTTAGGEGRISSKNKVGKLGLDVKPLTAIIYDPENINIGEDERPAAASPANDYSNYSDTSSFQMDFSSIFSRSLPLTENINVMEYSVEVSERDLKRSLISSKRRGGAAYGGSSDEDENGLAGAGRKKLRLTKQQSAFLEDSFKQHNTLNPKQKLVLANQLNLRPRQVEVWFQNRRARTKLKQTEVDCEYLKTCCETLTEENRRLHKELQELRALKTNSHPFYMQPPPTTLTMCPSCERVVTTTTTPATTTTELTKQPATNVFS